MQIVREQLTPTKLKLSVVAERAELDAVKEHVLTSLRGSVKVQGFRAGKAPLAMVEKQLDPSVFQSEFLDHGVNDLYVQAIEQGGIRPVVKPQISLTKFVPFSTLEFSAEVEVIGDIKLADYKKIKLAAKTAAATAADVDEVIESLRNRAANKQPVTRAAKNGDELMIDFTGIDAKTKEPIAGADGKDYPLLLGSKTFIPGFEDKLIGLKGGGDTSFDITFPKDYGSKELQNRKVNFSVTVHSVNELSKAKLDNAFAATVGPFKTVAELKADIKKQLSAERQREAQTAYDNELLEKLAEKTTVAIPQSLIEDEISRAEEEEKRNIVYRGQTWQEHLDSEGLSAEAHREKQRPSAELRVKAGLILGEVAQAEHISVSPEELEIRIMLLKNQYASDEAMLTELDKPEGRRDIQNRLMTEKTLEKLRTYSTAT